MATIKLKFRPSTVQGKAGTLCYQLCHRQENRQITTDMRIFPEWWNETKRELVTVPGNERVLTVYRKRAEKEMRDIREIIRELDCSGETYTLSEILNRYRSLPSESGFLYHMKKEMETLWENGQYGTSRNYRRALNSFSTFLDGNDIPFSSLDSALACRYEAWLWQQRVARNSSSFYMRKYSINSLVYWVTYVHNVVYSFYRSMIYCYINSTQRCAGSIVIDIIPTNGADKRKFFPFAPYFPVTNVIKRYFYPYFPAIIGIKGYSFPYFPYLSGIMKIKTALYSLFSRLDWHKTVVFPCLGEIYEGIRSLSWEIPVT